MDEHQIIWQDCLKLIRTKLPTETFSTWFLPVKSVQFDKDTILLEFPSQLSYEFVESHHFDLLKTCLDFVIKKDVKINYQIVDREPFSPEENLITNSTDFSDVTTKAHFNLNEKYTFENFIEGSSNQYAKAASVAVAEAPGKTRFNPLVIYGKSGLGKTHLIQAIGNFALQNGKIKNLVYLSSETFTNEFIKAIKIGKIAEFNAIYRNVDLLLVDDIQFFIGKERTQIEFFHTFNALHQAGKQIILTSDRPPNELDKLEERLISRFQWGLVTDIQPPDLETRIAILQKKAEQDNIEIPYEVVQFIAINITANIRELEGSLIKLIASSSFTHQPISIELAEKIIGTNSSTPKPVRISIEEIQKLVASELEIEFRLLLDKTRKQEIVYARQIAMHLCKEHTDFSLKTIGFNFGGRDHSTVIHAISSIEELIKKDASSRNLVETLSKKITFRR
ncbi:chromosomal replication initiator protein DnaA [bacterium]|nr:chromosomal replication initiator protein DnaA [bacterium]